MPWVRTEDDAPTHTKFFLSGVAAYGWWHAGLSYCNRELTDGFIPIRALALVFPGTHHDDILRLVEALVRERVLHTVSKGQRSGCPHPNCPRRQAHEDGYMMHDYFDYQPSRAEVMEQRRVRSVSGRKGGEKSRKTRKQVAYPVSEHGASTGNNPVPTRPDPSRKEEPESKAAPQGDTAMPVAAGTGETSKKPPRNGTKPAAVADPNNREAVKCWAELFEKHRGEKPIIAANDWPRLCAQVAPVVAKVGLDETRKLLERMFLSSHLKVTTSNYGLRFFAGEVNRWRGGTTNGGSRIDALNAGGEEAKRILRETVK